MASCILSSSKCFQYLKKLALAEAQNASEVSVFWKERNEQKNTK